MLLISAVGDIKWAALPLQGPGFYREFGVLSVQSFTCSPRRCQKTCGVGILPCYVRLPLGVKECMSVQYVFPSRVLFCCLVPSHHQIHHDPAQNKRVY